MDAYTNCALLFSHPIVEANGAAIFAFEGGEQSKMAPLSSQFIHSFFSLTLHPYFCLPSGLELPKTKWLVS
jgi:hypothetical protein